MKPSTTLRKGVMDILYCSSSLCWRASTSNKMFWITENTLLIALAAAFAYKVL